MHEDTHVRVTLEVSTERPRFTRSVAVYDLELVWHTVWWYWHQLLPSGGGVVGITILSLLFSDNGLAYCQVQCPNTELVYV